MRPLKQLPLLAIGIFSTLAAPPFVLGSESSEKPPATRADLVLPDSLWQRVLTHVDRTGRPLGYTADEMASFGRDALILRPVKNLFRDVRSIQRFGGKTAEDLIANASDPSEMVQRAFSLTDVAAGRMLPLPDSSSWGVDWMAKEVTPVAALELVLAHTGGGRPVGMGGTDRRAWRMLPEHVQRLVVRALIGAAEAGPWMRKAWEDPAFAPVLEQPPDGKKSAAASRRTVTRPPGPPAAETGADTAAVGARYRFAMAPWVELRMDQSATLSRTSLEALGRLDREYLEFGSVLFLAHLQRALKEYRTAVASDTGAIPASFPGCRFETAFGPVRICGLGPDSVDSRDFFTLDLGGDDHYLGRQGVPLSPARPIGVVLDLGGDDRYDGGPQAVSVGCGLFGLGAVFDLAGDDHYRSTEAGLGAGIFGVGLLVDYGGNDTYVLDTHDGQGSAVAGVGLLIDLDGDDAYTCGFSAQGFGETLGAGLLVDVKGNDTYLARDDGNPSALYNNQSVSMAQGVGQGRRADLGDGHSLAGGVGFLADGSGDDSYHATAWSQGAGYWWAAGFLEDLGGNDRYRNGKYSLGAGAHFAVGCQVDLSGDDLYNVGNDSAVNQYQGHARDGSIGISVDGDGNDQYYFRTHCGGSGDLNAIGFFWDRRGNDTYKVRYELLSPANGWTDTPPMGTATLYTPFRSFRDDMDAIGVFLDTGGSDVYEWEEPAAAKGEAAPAESAVAKDGSAAAKDASAATRIGEIPPESVRRPGNNLDWPTRRGPNSWGYGWDKDE